jgi:hypothetical protein
MVTPSFLEIDLLRRQDAEALVHDKTDPVAREAIPAASITRVRQSSTIRRSGRVVPRRSV